MTLLPADEVAEQQRLLATYRHTLAIYLRQQAELGGTTYSPPALLNGIDEARHAIARIKTLLRDAQVVVADDPDDEAEADWTSTHRERTAPVLHDDRAAQQPVPSWVLLVGGGLIGIVLVVAVMRLVAGTSLGQPPQATLTPTEQTYTVNSASMEPTLRQHQVVQIEPVDPAKLERGDIILIDPSGKGPFPKRVIGLPGETVSIHDDHVYIDGAQLPEPYTHGAPTTCLEVTVCAQGHAILIPSKSIFVLGDNRMNSSDSRELGPVLFSQIKGRVRQ
jgi:signal peptidase I